jgi:hypothetical protein
MSAFLFSLTSCTISFQNISVSGKGADVTDSERQDATADVSATIPTKSWFPF